MKRLAMVAVLLPFFALAQTATTEVLVLTTATALPIGQYRRAVEIQNLGPNPIFCALGDSSLAVLNKARRIAAGDAWALDAPSSQRIWCITSANQVTGAATIVSEVR